MLLDGDTLRVALPTNPTPATDQTETNLFGALHTPHLRRAVFHMDTQDESKGINKGSNTKSKAANKQTSKSNMFKYFHLLYQLCMSLLKKEIRISLKEGFCAAF